MVDQGETPKWQSLSPACSRWPWPRPCAVGGLGISTQLRAAGEPMVGGAPMYPDKTIPENASQAKNLTTLVAAVKAAGLVDTLASPGPFTVFAPTNAAFRETARRHGRQARAGPIRRPP